MTDSQREVLWDDILKETVTEPPTPDLEGISDPAARNRPVRDLQPETEMLRVAAHIRMKDVSSISQEFQMTIRAKKKLGPKAAAILLTVCSMEAVERGSDLTNYLALMFLLEVCKTYLRTANVNLDATKRAIALAETTILALGSSGWVKLTDRKRLEDWKEEKIKSLSFYPNLRTWRSWSDYYEPQQLLELQIVPLEQSLDTTNRTSIAYSGYCKGYHESGRGYRRDGHVYGEGRTPFDPEIDEDLVAVPIDLSLPIDKDPEYLSLTKAIQRAKEERHRK